MPGASRVFITEAGLQFLEEGSSKPTKAERMLYELRQSPEGILEHRLGLRVFWTRGERSRAMGELLEQNLIEIEEDK